MMVYFAQAIVACCRRPNCVLSYEAVAALRARGFTARRLEDGLPEWRAAGLPVIAGGNRLFLLLFEPLTEAPSCPAMTLFSRLPLSINGLWIGRARRCQVDLAQSFPRHERQGHAGRKAEAPIKRDDNIARLAAAITGFPMFPILFIVLCLVVLLVVMGPMMTRHEPRRHWRDSEPMPHKKAFEILNERLAKSEIDKSEYSEKHRTIVQGQ